MKYEGFYKLDNNELLYAPNFVENRNYYLDKSSKDFNTYPIDGWYWFNGFEDACIFFELNKEDYEYAIGIFKEPQLLSSMRGSF